MLPSPPMDPRIAKCLLLAKVLLADGMVTENERIFLDKVMDDYGLDEEARQRVIKLQGLNQAEHEVAKLPTDEKREFLSLLVDGSSADGRLSPLEMATVKSITAALGLD